jgi:transposase
MTERRHELTDEQWAELVVLLPPEKPHTGRPSLAHRQIMNGILWVLRTGAPWRDMPERYGKWQTVYSRFRRWREAGVWDRVLAAVQAKADQQDDIEWEIHYVDGRVVRAHQHAAGAKKGATKP